MSLYVLPVAVSDLEQLQLGIEFFTNSSEATTEAAAINATGATVSVASYANQLLASNISLSQVAMGVDSLMFGVTDTVADLTSLSTVFLPPQVAQAIAQGYNPTVYAAQALGLALANGNNIPSNAFATTFGTMSAGNFAIAVQNITGTSASAIQGWVQYWEAFYTGNPGAAGGDTPTLAAYGAAFGEAVGVALLNPTGATLQQQVANALFDNAQGSYVAGIALGAEPVPLPFQSGPGSNVYNLPITIVNITAPLPGATFNALPAVSVFSGIGNNTLVSGDVLTDTGGGGTLNDVTTFLTIGANPPYATNVTLTGITTANITGTEFVFSGFQGDITGLTTVNVKNSTGGVQVGNIGDGLNTLLTNVNITGWAGGVDAFMFIGVEAAAAASASATISLGLTGPIGDVLSANIVSLSNDTGSLGTTASPNLTAGTLAISASGPTFLTLTANGASAGFVYGAPNVTGFTAITTTGAGNIALSTDAVGNFAELASVTALATDTGNLVITGAASGAVGNALATPLGNPGWLFGGSAGLLAGDTSFTKFVGTTTGTNILDVSSETAGFSADVFVGNTASGVVNQLVVNDAIATSAASSFNAGDTGWQQLDVTGIGGTINQANLPASVDDIFYLTPASGAVSVTHAVSGLTIDTEANAGGFGLTVSSAAAAGASSTLGVVVGDATWATGGEFAFSSTEALGPLTITGESIVNISSVGAQPTFGFTANTIGVISLTPVLTLNEQVNISGNTNVTIGVDGLGAIADFNPTSPTTLNFNNMTLNDTDSGVVTLAAATGGPLNFAVPGDTGSTLSGSINAEVINASTSGGLVMQGSDVNFTSSATPVGSVGDVITGSATGGNVIAGSIGNDVITVLSGVPNTIDTGGGGDTITLAAGSHGDLIELYTPFDSGPAFYGTATGVLPGQEMIPRFASITDASDLAQAGWWGLGTSGPATGYNAAGTNYGGLVGNDTGTSADGSTIVGFTPKDVLDFGASTGFGHGAIWDFGGLNGLGGIALGLVNGGLTPVLAPTVLANTFAPAVVQQAGATGTLIAAGTDFIELTGTTFLTAGAVATALGTASYNLVLAAALPADGSAHILVGWEDPTGASHISDVALANIAPTADTDAMFVHVSDLAILTGVALTSLTSHQIHFV